MAGMISTYCGNYADRDHSNCPSSVECATATLADAEPILYMECKGCGEVFEQTGENPRHPDAAVAHQLHDQPCRGRGFKRDLTEDEAF